MGIRKLLLVSCLLGLASVAGAQDLPPPPPDGGDDMPPPPPPPDGEPPPAFCITPSGPCEAEGPCGEGGECLDGVCIVKGNECKGPDDCDERSACFAFGNECKSQDQCREPFVCMANVCVAVLLGPPPDGMMCPADDRVCQMGGEPVSCMDPSQCAGGDCVEGQCIFREGEGCMDESCVTADGAADTDGDGKPDGEGEDVGDQEQDVRDQIQDQKDMQMQPLACSVSTTGGSKLGGLGLLLALSTLLARRRRA